MQRKPSLISSVSVRSSEADDADDDESGRPASWKFPCWLKGLVVFHLVVGLFGLAFAGSSLARSGAVETGAAAAAVPKVEALSESKFEAIPLRSGLQMPALGFGTCCRPSAHGPAVIESTIRYLKAGGRLVDTAMAYGNHKEIGSAIASSGVPRENIWLTSKIAPNTVKSRNATIAACDAILSDLGVRYLDLLLIHSPKLKQEKTTELWLGLIELKRTGKVKAIGVSNFNWLEILALQKATGELPEVNQLQFHPWTPRQWKAVVTKQQESGVSTTAYTSLGGSRFRSAGSNWGEVLKAAAAKYNATEAQVLLRWALQQGVAVIPGSSSEAHICENLRVPFFTLGSADKLAIENSPPPPSWFDPKRGPAKFEGKLADVPWHL